MLIRPQSLAILLVLWMASLFAAAPVAAQTTAQSTLTFPTLTGRVVDQANILDVSDEQKLDAQLAQHENDTSNQIVVVTVNSLGGYDIADYALRLGREWGIGTEDKNNGIILLVAPNERKVRIEVGYGLEGALPDGLAGQIIRRNILPQFKEQDYPTGIKSGVNAVLQAVAGEYKAEPTRTTKRPTGADGSFDFIPLFFIGMVAIPGLLRKSGLYRVANAAFPAGFVGLASSLVAGNLIVGLLFGVAVFIVIYFMNPKGGGPRGGGRTGRIGRHGRHGMGGGFGGGRFGGGGFGGGGGSFGGGGASGSW